MDKACPCRQFSLFPLEDSRGELLTPEMLEAVFDASLQVTVLLSEEKAQFDWIVSEFFTAKLLSYLS